jgi:signal transduction histidine kinase
MTSHEMRNPLSAVVQCADVVSESINQVSTLIATESSLLTTATKEKLNENIQHCLDSIQTIISCSMHQKSIVDEILTLSKLGSNLIAITPVIVNPVNVVTEAVKMFEAECNKENIQLSFRTDPSLAEENAHLVRLDPSRLLQVGKT